MFIFFFFFNETCSFVTVNSVLLSVEMWASSAPPADLNIFSPISKDGLRPIQEMGFLTAVRKGFLDAREGSDEEEQQELVDWCLFDAIFTPFFNQVSGHVSAGVRL